MQRNENGSRTSSEPWMEIPSSDWEESGQHQKNTKTKTQTKTLHTHKWGQILEIGKRGVFQAGKQGHGHLHKGTSICKVITGIKEAACSSLDDKKDRA